MYAGFVSPIWFHFSICMFLPRFFRFCCCIFIFRFCILFRFFICFFHVFGVLFLSIGTWFCRHVFDPLVHVLAFLLPYKYHGHVFHLSSKLFSLSCRSSNVSCLLCLCFTCCLAVSSDNVPRVCCSTPSQARRWGNARYCWEQSFGSGVAKAGASCSRPAMAVISASCINWLLVMCGGRKLTTVPKVPRALRHACLPKQLCWSWSAFKIIPACQMS